MVWAWTRMTASLFLWDISIHTDRTIPANTPDIVLKNKKDKTCLLIDMTTPLDTNTLVKTTEKLTKYKDLEIEVERMWGAQNNNSPGCYGSSWHHQEGHGKLLQQNPWQHQHTWTPENNSPFYSPPSQAGPLHQVETLFASQSPWFGLGCWERKSIAITPVYLI